MKKLSHDREIVKEVTRWDNGILYRYVLYSSKSKRVASYSLSLYSIEVIMTKDGEVTKNTVEDIFSDVGKAVSFFEKISQNLATPIDLTYILEDRIAF